MQQKMDLWSTRYLRLYHTAAANSMQLSQTLLSFRLGFLRCERCDSKTKEKSAGHKIVAHYVPSGSYYENIGNMSKQDENITQRR